MTTTIIQNNTYTPTETPYQSTVRQMDNKELMYILKSYALVLDDTDPIDVDELIEAYEYEHGTMFESKEDDILDTIMNGNWSDAVEQMLESNVTPSGLVDYIEEYREELGAEYYNWFTLDSAVAITELFYRTRNAA